MLSKGATLVFFAVSIIGMNILLFRALQRSRDLEAAEGVYRYSKDFRVLFLFMIPVYLGLLVVIAFSGRKPPQGSGVIAFSAMGMVMLALPVLGYAYAKLYSVTVDTRGVTVSSLLGTRFVAFSEIAAIATMRGRGTDYWFFSSAGACIAKIGGSVENFESLKFDVESAVQSRRVMLYEFDRISGWRERSNDPNDDWRKSEGPALIAARNRRVSVEMLMGTVLVAVVIAYVHYYLPR